MLFNVWFRFGDKLRHDELRRVSVHGFAQFREAVKVVFQAKREAIDRFCNSLFLRRKFRHQTTALYFWWFGKC